MATTDKQRLFFRHIIANNELKTQNQFHLFVSNPLNGQNIIFR